MKWTFMATARCHLKSIQPTTMPVGGNTGKWVNQKDQNIFANQSLLWLVSKFDFALYEVVAVTA